MLLGIEPVQPCHILRELDASGKTPDPAATPLLACSLLWAGSFLSTAQYSTVQSVRTTARQNSTSLSSASTPLLQKLPAWVL